MPSNVENLEIYRGDTENINLAFTNDAEEAIDITGATIHFTVKHFKDDADSVALIQKEIDSHTNAAGGLSQINIVAADTQDLEPAVYVYDIQIEFEDGTKKTIVIGNFSILHDITRV